MPNGHGGARVGAGRKPKQRSEADIVQALAATLVEMAVGQSKVALELDSSRQVKPSVTVYGNDVAQAGKTAEAEFDRLMDKYHPKAPPTAPASLEQFTDADLALLGLKRAEK